MDRRSPAPSCGDLRRGDEKAYHAAGVVIDLGISAYCPDQAPARSVNVRTTASRRDDSAPTECGLSSSEASTSEHSAYPVLFPSSDYSTWSN